VEALLAFFWRFALEFWPLTMVDKWELGLRVRVGKYLTPLEPGLRVSLPFIDTVLTENATLRSVNLEEQTMTTVDRVNVSAGGVIWYHVVDLKKLWMEVENHEDSMSNLAMVALAGKLGEVEFTECSLMALQGVAQKKIRGEARKWGIYVDGFQLTDLCESQVFRFISPGGAQALVITPED